jgi:hypothetical protein
MSTFIKGGSTGTPFGRNEILRSTNPKPRTESYMLAAATVPTVTFDGVAGQKIFQPGVVLAKITSGGDAGKVGPALIGVAGITDGRQTAANIVGINYTFLPWQLMERDVEISAIYEGSLVQAWCLEYNVAGLTNVSPIALTDATALLMQRGGAAGKGIDITWR